MKKDYPTIICWRITSECDRSCPFCFRPDCRDLNTEKICKVIDNLAQHGVRGIGITGGEPLLKKDIIEILKYIWDKNIRICLATNADFYNKYQEPINKYVAAIGLPVEGSTERIHDSLRGAGNFHNVMAAIDKIYRKSKLQMYFSTVLTGNNIDDLVNIESLLAKYQDKTLYWKIYDIIDYPDRLSQSIKNNTISEKKAKKVINTLGGKLDKNKIFYLSPKNRSRTSLIINPDGEAIVPIDKSTKTKDFVLGNFLKDGADKIFDNWSKAVDYNKYVCHKCALRCMGKPNKP